MHYSPHSHLSAQSKWKVMNSVSEPRYRQHSKVEAHLLFHHHLVVFLQVIVGPLQLPQLDLGIFQFGLQLLNLMHQGLFFLPEGCLHTLRAGFMLTHASVHFCISDEAESKRVWHIQDTQVKFYLCWRGTETERHHGPYRKEWNNKQARSRSSFDS